MDPNDRIHCLVVERRELVASLWLWRAWTVLLVLILLPLLYGYAMHWAGVW